LGTQQCQEREKRERWRELGDDEGGLNRGGEKVSIRKKNKPIPCGKSFWGGKKSKGERVGEFC